MISKLIRLFALCSLAAICSVPAQAASWQDKVSPQVLAAAAQGETDLLVVMAVQADLSAADSLRGKAAKGEYVYRTLSEFATREQTSLRTLLDRQGAEYRSYWIANLLWVRADATLVETLARRADVSYLAANPAVQLDLPAQTITLNLPQAPDGIEWNISKVNADDLWDAGFTGQGVVVGGQDTGYDWDHPALKAQYRGWNGLNANHDYNWHDAIHATGSSCGANSPVPCDDHGHGTHTMGTMVGDDGGSNRIGMAPGARWIGCRNMNSGYGTPTTYTECFEWFVAPTKVDGTLPRPDLAPDVINNSWGCPLSEGCDLNAVNAMQIVVENVRAAGIMVVASAGNSGSSCGSVNDPPAVYDASFSVGNTTSSDTISAGSSRGPADYTGLPKPDISAPGTDIRSSYPGVGYTSMSGTSMAGPHVAGQVALLLSVRPDLRGDVDTLEDLIRQSALPRTTTQNCGGVLGSSVPNNTYGWGRIDAWAAYQLAVTHSLTLDKQAPPQVYPAQPITYTLTLEHAGFLPTHGIVLTDTLPISTTFVSASAPYTLTDGLIEWGFAQLDANQQVSVTLTVLPLAEPGEDVVNAAYGVRSQQVTQTVGGPSVVTRILNPQPFSLSKQAPAWAQSGSVITYTLTITNQQAAPAASLILTDTIPANTSLITATLPFTRTGDLITWPIAELAAGGVEQFTLTVQTPITFTGTIIDRDYGLRRADFSFVVLGEPVTTRLLRFYHCYIPILFKP